MKQEGSKTATIDQLNIGLIVISLAAAVIIPFELFLFSYAVLGPLHYLTEINWLKEKNYFLKSNKNWFLVFLLFAFILSIYPTVEYFDFFDLPIIEKLANYIQSQKSTMLLWLFLFSVGLILIKKPKYILFVFASSIALTIIASTYLSYAVLLLGVFLPTLIHVYIFTFLFIIFGARKTNSKAGYLLATLLLIIPFIIAYLPVELINNKPSQNTIETFNDNHITGLNSIVADLFNTSANVFDVLSEIGIRIQIFIAFAYTYHYLNWFSKTSIIGWNKTINRRNALVILIVWVASISLYLYDFRSGFIALFFLSFLHVLLELPLNALTIKDLFSNYRKHSNK